ncbi:kinase-like protein [Corynespora cassiicola Philippines]|uniref:Kinase-like protein n=1 Tax=Corynespora cassiicola Philippines TaxID=1448308 RepID=A0A2T2N8V9_CORCC|nr:kinase-like protein [Corynespora cassiicola Philippines]
MGALFSCFYSKDDSAVNDRPRSIKSYGKPQKNTQYHREVIVPTSPIGNRRQTRIRNGDEMNDDYTQPTYNSTRMPILQDKIQKELILLAKGSEEENSEIILEQDLKDFWTEPRRSPFYTNMPWYHLIQNETGNSMGNYFKIFSILIQINFREWNSFQGFFIETKKTDDDIPFSLEDLSGDAFLGPCNGKLFYNTQWVFCPIVITEKQEPCNLKGTDLNLRFPFISRGEKVGEGACGVVHRQLIAARHLVFTERCADTRKDYEVAVKVITQSRFLVSELDNHKSLSRCLTKHSNIMVNIATIIREQPITGNVYHIFYELAAYDLEKMLTRPWGANRKKRYRSALPKRNGSDDVRPSNFINESRHLVDALDFLHHRLYADAQVSLAHNDLTPRNILVFFPNDADSEVRYPVGQWKIADFGLSKIKDTRKSKHERKFSSHLHPNSQGLAPDLTPRQITAKLAGLSLTPAKRPPGRYTPPEIKEDGNSELNAKMGDVWAFGALFSEILAYAVGEHKLVEGLRKTFEEDEEDRFFDPATSRLKASFNDWISELPEKNSTDNESRMWIEECVALIRNILVQDASQRFPAAKIRDELQAIYTHMLGKEQPLPWLTVDTSAASSIQSSRSASAHSGATTTSPEGFDDNLSILYKDQNAPRSPSFVHTIEEC